MEIYRTLDLVNTYSDADLDNGIPMLETAGIQVYVSDSGIITLNFDVVDMKYLEKQTNHALITDTLTELWKIRSFSSANGKIVFKSFNKAKRVLNKDENKKKRLGYEYYQKHFSYVNNALPQEYLDKIHCADSYELLKKLPDNCIDLVVTSPPYNFGINYNSSNDVNIWEEYFKQLFLIFGECVRVLKNGGRIILNIQPLFSDYVPSHHMVSNFFIQQGLIWKGEIIWEKNNYNCKYCTWGSWQSPSSPYLKYSWEFIEIFCKNTLKKDGEKENIDISAEEFKKWVYGKWSIAPERHMKEFQHAAMFPEELVKRAIKLFSYKNDIVLDPFNGAGTTTKVARTLDRHFIGIDIDESYCETARKRLQKTDSIFNSEEENGEC